MRVRNGLGIVFSVGVAFSLIVGMSGCSSSRSSETDSELQNITGISTGTDSLYAIAVGDSEVRVLSVLAAGGYEGVHDPGLDTYSDDVAYGTLLAVAPIAGLTYTDTEIVLDDIEKGSTIYYGVSLGPDPASGVNTGVEYVQVPDLVTYGYTEAQAKVRLEAVGLELGPVIELDSATVAKGCIISTTPMAGTMVEKGSSVSIVVSAGSAGSTGSTAAKPPTLVRGMTEEAVVNALEAAGFIAYHDKTLDRYDDDVDAGLFLTLDPSVNSANLQPGATIGYGLSLGQEPWEEEIDTTPKTVTVPNMSGWYYSTARSTLQDYGFYVTEVWEYSSTTDANDVIYTYPAAGSVLNYGDTVTIHISLGPETVYVDYDYYTSGSWNADSAQRALEDMGLNVSVDYSNTTDDLSLDGVVYAMSNSGNLTVGSWIHLYVYNYVEPEPVYTEPEISTLIEVEDDTLTDDESDMLIEPGSDTLIEAEY